MNARGWLATLAVLLAAAGVFAWGTDGFTAYTAETARRAEVLRHPRPIPQVRLQGADGATFTLQELRGRPLAIEFIYTRCQTICRSLGAAFQQIQRALPPQGPGSELQLLSISFDPAADDSAALRAWARLHGADARRWRIARPLDEASLRELLLAFGVVVVPDGLGGYEHNAAIHLLDARGRLVRISDIEAPAAFLAALQRMAPDPA